jgi:hypothetical protein
MKQEFVEKIFSTLFPDSKIQILSYTVLDRQQLNEKNEWVKDSPAIFIVLSNIDGDVFEDFYLTEYLSNLTGFEFNISKM